MPTSKLESLVDLPMAARIDRIDSQITASHSLHISVKREDLAHPLVSGNKWRKLKYNLQQVMEEKAEGVLTFGGAYSNHIAATACAAQFCGVKSIGIIRGEKPARASITLRRAEKQGMHLVFVSREEYRQKEDPEFLKNLQKKFPGYFIVPEGGSNEQGVRGCEEILSELAEHYDYVACPCGTAATMAGLLRTAQMGTKILGFACHRDSAELQSQLGRFAPGKSNYDLISDYHFGGFAKGKDKLDPFIFEFQRETNIPIEFVYTGKMFYGLFDLIKKKYFPAESRILCIHTGGLQYTLGENV